MDASGIITTFAGSGSSAGFAGDGGPAVNAQLSTLAGLAVDQAGNLYIADAGNYRVRKVDTSGVITTVAGNGQIDLGGTGDGGAVLDQESYRSWRHNCSPAAWRSLGCCR